MLISEKQVVLQRASIESLPKDALKETIKALNPSYSQAHELVQTALFSAVKTRPLKVHYYQRLYETRSIFSYDVSLNKKQHNSHDGSFLQIRVEQHQPLSRHYKPSRDMHTMRELQQLMLRLDQELPDAMHMPLKTAVGTTAVQLGGMKYNLSCVSDGDATGVQLWCDKTRQRVEFNFYH